MMHSLIHTSKMTGKLEDMQAISTNTMTNEYCIKQNASDNANNICTKCYTYSWRIQNNFILKLNIILIEIRL